MKTLAITLMMTLAGLGCFSQIKSHVNIDLEANLYKSSDLTKPEIFEPEFVNAIFIMNDSYMHLFCPAVSSMIKEIRFKNNVADLMMQVEKEIQQEKSRDDGALIDSPVYNPGTGNEETNIPYNYI